MNSTTLDLRAIIPSNQWTQFVADLIYKPLEQLSKEGRIDGKTISMVNNYLEKYGAGSIPFSCETVDIPTLHSYHGGLLAKIRWPILRGKLEITTFLKRFKDTESYQKALGNQRVVQESLRGTTLEGMIMEPLYSNNGLNIMVTPFVNGKSLDETLPHLEGPAKLKKITALFKSYFQWKKAMEGKLKFVPRLGNPLDSLSSLVGCPSGESFFELMKPLCEELHNSPRTILHGDLNLGNIVEADPQLHPQPFYFIDWETLSSGYLEYDIGKILSKARLSLEDRKTVVENLAEIQQEHYGHDPQTTIRRHWLNFIRHHTNTIGRYLSRAQTSPAFTSLANVAYNKSLQTIYKAMGIGVVDEKFLRCYQAYFENERSLTTLLPEQLESLGKKFDPDQRPSFENLAHPPSLDEIAGSILSPPLGDPTPELARLKKNLYPSKARLLGRRTLLSGIIGLIGFGSLKAGSHYLEMRKEILKQKTEEGQTFEDSQYHSWFRGPYERAIEAINSAEELKTPLEKLAYPPWKCGRPLSRDDSLIKDIASTHGFEPAFIQRILDINHFYALTYPEHTNLHYRSVNFFEPGIEWHGTRFGRHTQPDMTKNLQEGITLLASFRDQFRGSYTLLDFNIEPFFEEARFLSAFSLLKLDEYFQPNNTHQFPTRVKALLDLWSLKDALIAFYSRKQDENPDAVDNFRMGRTLAYNVLRGLGADDMSGIQYIQDEKIYFGPEFDFTSKSPLTKGKIAALDYWQLREVKQVEERRLTKWSMVRKP